MACAPENVVETSFEHMFARDLICFVLRDCMTGLHWTPTELLTGTDLESPFTPELKAAVKEQFEIDGHKFHELFDRHFPDKSRIDDSYTVVCRNMKKSFVSKEFDMRELLTFSILLAYFAGLCHLYRGTSGDITSCLLIIEAIRELQKLGKIDEKIWYGMQNWLENNKEPVRRWSSVFQ